MVTIPRPAAGLGSTTAAVDNVIDVRNLHVEFHTSLGTVRAVNGGFPWCASWKDTRCGR